MPMTTLSEFWKVYNSEESWSPLIFPLIIWTGCFVYCKMFKSPEHPNFHKWEALHNLYNYGVILIAIISIYYDDDTILSERVSIFYTISYFLVDSMDCFLRRDWQYSVHGLLTLGGALMNYSIPPLRELRMNSRANLCELSSPVFFVAKKTRKPLHFVLFALTFTCCRILWIPRMLHRLLIHGVTWTSPPVILLILFYSLNCYWYTKIIGILVSAARGEGENVGTGGESSSKEKDDKED